MWTWLIAAIVVFGAASAQADAPWQPAAHQASNAAPATAVATAEFALVPAASQSRVIDLSTALRLAETSNPSLGVSRAALFEAIALQRSARVLMLPDLNAGANYGLHTGPLLASSGRIFNEARQQVYVGGGAGTLAAETIKIPMVRIFGHLGDAYYLPLAAQQEVATRSAENQALTNEILLEVVSRYLELAAAEARLDAWSKSLGELSEVERTTRSFAKTGQGREGDAQRAHGDALLVRVEAVDTQAEALIASNELARLLRLDPSIHLTTLHAPLELVDLVDAQQGVEELVELAQRLRPEVRARAAQANAAQQRYAQELTRPFLPTVMVGYSAGGFGGGSNNVLIDSQFYQRFGGRSDFDVWAFWTLQNFGAGNLALQNQRRAERREAVGRQSLNRLAIRRQVVEAYAAAQAARLKLDVVVRELETAQRGAEQELNRIRLGEGLPIEVLNNVVRLAQARQDAIAAVVNYNLAQFRLFVAVGQRPSANGPNPVPVPVAAPAN